MPRPTPTPPTEDPAEPGARGAARPDGPWDGALATALPDLSALPIAGITRRRLGIILSAVIAAWIVVVFARQVGEASAATSRADVIAQDNEALRLEVAGMRRELQLIQRQEYVVQQARAYRLGTVREVPFSLAPDAPPLADDAPGSAAVRVGSESERITPLERWLDLLFGPGTG